MKPTNRLSNRTYKSTWTKLNCWKGIQKLFLLARIITNLTLPQQLQLQHIIELETKAKQDLEQAIKEDEATQVLLLNDSNESENGEQGRVNTTTTNNNTNNNNNTNTAKTQQLLSLYTLVSFSESLIFSFFSTRPLYR